MSVPSESSECADVQNTGNTRLPSFLPLWDHLHSIFLTFDPNAVQGLSARVLLKGDIGVAMRLDRIVEVAPETEVILITGQYSAESAVEAIRRGACDYITKPINLNSLRERIAKLVAEAQQRQTALQLDTEALKTYQFEGMIGRSRSCFSHRRYSVSREGSGMPSSSIV